MLKEKPYQNFVISWMEPPATTQSWEMSIAPANRDAKARLERALAGQGSFQLQPCASRGLRTGVAADRLQAGRLSTPLAPPERRIRGLG